MAEYILDREGCPVHYWLGGVENCPLVALLHGATMDHRMFDEQVSALTGDYRVLVWDARGHGKSQPIGGNFTLKDCADDLIAILDRHEMKQVALVGQSMGGYIAQYVYLDYPDRVNSMVVIGAISIALSYAKWEIWLLKATLPMLDYWPYGNFTRSVARSVSIKPEVQVYALEAIQQIKRKDFLTIWKAVTLAIDEKGIPGHHINVPFLLTHGDHDTLGSIRKYAPVWAANEPTAEYVVIPDAGHNANQDNALFFNTRLLKFLTSHTHP